MYSLERFEKTTDVKKYFEKYVNIEEFLKYCEECPNYQKVWTCPSFNFNPKDYWNAYKTLTVIAYKIDFDEGISEEEGLEIMKKVKADMSEELYELERHNPGSISLSAGSCNICSEEGCTRPSGLPCRYPEKMRYSIEAIGGNVGKTVSDFLGIKLQWMEEGKLPAYFVLAGGLLSK